MVGSVSDERSVKVPASEAWKLYGSLHLVKIIEEAISNVVSKIDVVKGDGGVGTILEAFFHPGVIEGMTSYKEKFTVLDNERRVKEVEVVEGGWVDLGFTLYRVRFEVIEVPGKENEECNTRSTIEYEVEEEAAAKAAADSIQLFIAVMQYAADYLQKNYNSNI